MRCLVTGAPGFAGSHLVAHLLTTGAEVSGIALPGESLARLEGLSGKVDIRTADIADADGLRDAAKGDFDVVFHLAALASVPASLKDPAAAFRVNTLGTINLLEALKSSPPGRLVYISTADVYGRVPQENLPVRETEATRPANPYAASKVAAEAACLQYWRTFGLPVIILRPFNHTGPGQALGFAPSDFAAAIARIEKGIQEPLLTVGNLESSRDFSDVRDIVRAYVLAARTAEPGEIYNISSGVPVKIASILETLLGLCSLDIEVAQDPARLRPSDTPVVVGDNSKFKTRTGWLPAIPLEETLAALLDSWRNRV